MSLWQAIKFLFSPNQNSYNETSQIRKPLIHPSDLQQGDIVKFAFCKQTEISGQEFEITKVNSYIYDGQIYPEYIMKNRDGLTLFMMIENEDGEETISISKKINKQDMITLFSEDILDLMCLKGNGYKINIQQKLSEYDEWLANNYTKTDTNVQGAFISTDPLALDRMAILPKGESFTSHIFTNESDEYSIEIEIYSSNELEACATIYLEVEDIEEMWPAA
jgi:hypothetical protein